MLSSAIDTSDKEEEHETPCRRGVFGGIGHSKIKKALLSATVMHPK